MAKAFVDRGYDIISGGTDNHLMLIDLRNKGVTGKATEQALVRAHITANKNMVPFDDKSPFTTSGIRLGAPAITTRGLKEADMETITDFIDRVVTNIDSDTHIKEVGDAVCLSLSLSLVTCHDLGGQCRIFLLLTCPSDRHSYVHVPSSGRSRTR